MLAGGFPLDQETFSADKFGCTKVLIMSDFKRNHKREKEIFAEEKV